MNNNNNATQNATQKKQEIMAKYKIDDNEIVLAPSILQHYILGS